MCRYLLEASARNKAKSGVASHSAIPPEPPGAGNALLAGLAVGGMTFPRLDQEPQARDQAARCRDSASEI